MKKNEVPWYYVARRIIDPLCRDDRLSEKEVLDIFFSSDICGRVLSGRADINRETEILRSLTPALNPLEQPPNGKAYGWAVGIILSNVQRFSEIYGTDPVETYRRLRSSPLMDDIISDSDLWQIDTEAGSFGIIEDELCKAFRLTKVKAIKA